ncbi:hypothetical protein D3C72_2259160 [compost metagenome]
MGFDEKDYEILVNSEICKNKERKLFTRDRLYKLAGNSIVVNVLEEIFKQALYIKENILQEETEEVNETKLNILKKKLALLANLSEDDEGQEA